MPVRTISCAGCLAPKYWDYWLNAWLHQYNQNTECDGKWYERTSFAWGGAREQESNNGTS